MSTTDGHQLTLLLKRVSAGEERAQEELLAVVYPELRRLAAKRMRLERAGHTWQPTDLVNEIGKFHIPDNSFEMRRLFNTKGQRVKGSKDQRGQRA